MELLQSENRCLAKGRRGPKPLSVRAKFAATAWLDGDILWREGRVVWRVDGREIIIGPRELEGVSRALCSLKRHEKAAKHQCADFDAWHAHRVQQWQKTRHLASPKRSKIRAQRSRATSNGKKRRWGSKEIGSPAKRRPTQAFADMSRRRIYPWFYP